MSKSRNNPPKSYHSVSYIIENQFRIMTDYHISIRAIRDLMLISDRWLSGGKSSTPTSLLEKGKYSGASYNSLYKRLGTMLRNGMIDNVGSDEKMLLVPTLKGLKVLDRLVEKE